jgi:hypothetical protein
VGVVRGFVVNVGKWAMGFQSLYPLCRIGDTVRADVAGVVLLLTTVHLYSIYFIS